MSALALIVAATLAQAGTLRSDLALRGGGAGRSVVDYAQWTSATTMTGSTCDVRASDLLTWKGRAITVSRSDSTLCCPESDASCCTAAPNQLCVHGPAYNGWASIGTSAGGAEVFGPAANALTYTEKFANAAWVKSTGVSASDEDAACPMSPLSGTRMSLVTTDSDADQIAQDAATTPGRSVWMARATGDSACGITFADADGTGAQSVALTDGPVRYWSGGTGQTGLSVARPAGGCARWCMWAAQAQAVVYPVPYRTVSGGTPYSGAASTATTISIAAALTDPSRWAIAWTGTHAWGTAAYAALWSMGVGDAADSATLYDRATGFEAYSYAGATGRSRTWTFARSTGQHTVLFERSTAFDLTVDAVPITGSAYTGGTGIQTALPSTIYVGGAGSTYQISGLVSRVAQCRKAGGCR